MRLKLFLVAALLGLAWGCRQPEQAPLPEGSIEWSAVATADKKEIQVGEELSVRVTVTHPPGAEFLILTGAELAPFELIERRDEPASTPVESVVTLRVAAYRLPGEIALPPIKIEYRDASGEVATLETESIPIRLVTSLTPDVTDINDIKGPIEDLPLPSHWGRLWWLLAALLAALLAYILYRRRRRKEAAPEEVGPAPPPIPADVEAEQALRQLANARLLEQGRFLEFYTALAEIAKRYAGRRFGVPYLERTTAEMLTDLRPRRLASANLDRLRGILNAADLVKFARIRLPDEESERMIPEAFRFVDETRPRPTAPAVPVSPAGREGQRV